MINTESTRAGKALQLPLCVDCDGTLIYTDLLCESFLLFLKKHFFLALRVPFWFLLYGKAVTKLRIAEKVMIDVTTLPYCPEVLHYIGVEKAKGRQIVLVTASVEEYADAVAAHVGVFDAVIGTKAVDKINITASRKAAHLNALYGKHGYEYIGNSSADLAVWADAGQIAIANASKSVTRRAHLLGRVVFESQRPHSPLKAVLKALRLHQWLKNLLVFVPLVAAHKISDAALAGDALLAFFAFGFCASSVYVLNDMLDIESDRTHSRKKLRPFAAGTLSIPLGGVVMLLCLAVSCGLLLLLPKMFAVLMALYYISTLAYSFRLKRQVIVDVMLLSGLYTVRILAGAAATNIIPSFWLLSFSMFIFLSLALVKRYSEMRAVAQKGQARASGRGYIVDDITVLLALGASSGFSAVQVLALYINGPEVHKLYLYPQFLWLIIPLMLYWISRIWLKSHHGEMHDDPVVFAIKDWQSLVIGGVIAWVAFMASVPFKAS